jgi:hypothetical protein
MTNEVWKRPLSDEAEMRAFGASEMACYLYPGEDQAKERAAFCEGAARTSPKDTDVKLIYEIAMPSCEFQPVPKHVFDNPPQFQWGNIKYAKRILVLATPEQIAEADESCACLMCRNPEQLALC